MKFDEINLMLESLRMRLVDNRDDDWKMKYNGLRMSVENEITINNIMLTEVVKKYNEEHNKLTTDLLYMRTSISKIPIIRYFNQKQINKKSIQLDNLIDSHDNEVKRIKFNISILQTTLESIINVLQEGRL